MWPGVDATDWDTISRAWMDMSMEEGLELTIDARCIGESCERALDKERLVLHQYELCLAWAAANAEIEPASSRPRGSHPFLSKYLQDACNAFPAELFAFVSSE
jgi:hypothetical protein